MSVLLGCIADDFTGGSDLAGVLVRHGMRTIMAIGVPDAEFHADADAIVVALKSRTLPVAQAVDESIKALRWLQTTGALQIFSKYCSTFDSTSEGNIGPVAEALMEGLDSNFTIACPAFPANRRTVYQGHLFVGEVLLSESGMRTHPLTPMTDSNLVRVLGAQVKRRVGLVDYSVVDQGYEATEQRLNELKGSGFGFAVVDAVSDSHLLAIARAVEGLPLITGGSGIAQGLPESFRRRGLLDENGTAACLSPSKGARVVISGSCSEATNRQVALMRESHESFQISPLALADGTDVTSDAVAWACARLGDKPILIYSSALPDEVRAVQERFGARQAGELVERALADIAKRLVACGARQLIIAGGETSGAVVRELGVMALRIGSEIDPGVPWTEALGMEIPIALALKSGNFGSVDFFLKAWNYIQ